VLILDTCQRLLNRHVAESTAAMRRIAALEGRSFAIEVGGLDLRIVMQVREGQVVLRADRDAPAEATIEGTPLDLLGLVGSDSLRRLRSTRAALRGDVQVAEAFAEMLRCARPELEGELAGWVGDIAAHRAGEFARSLLAWGARAGQALEMDVAEYLQEESAALPGAARVRSFYVDVERLRDDVERSAQRLERLVRRARSAAGG
jgi:ubiquinone biosynthesis protein UbiJ